MKVTPRFFSKALPKMVPSHVSIVPLTGTETGQYRIFVRDKRNEEKRNPPRICLQVSADELGQLAELFKVAYREAKFVSTEQA